METPLASDLSQQVLQLRRLRGELSAPELDSTNRRLHGLPSQLVQRESFIASRETVHTEIAWEVQRQQRRLQG
jgi:hypothetical protein